MRRCGLTDHCPDRDREMAVVAPEHRQIGGESSRLLPNPSNLSLIKSNGFGIGDLHAPAALRLPVQPRDDAEANESMMNILGQPFRRNRELNSRATILGREDAPVARHQGPQKFPKSLAVPAPHLIW